MTKTEIRFTWRAAALTFGIWTVVGLLTSELAILAVERSGGAPVVRTIVLGNLVSVWIWVAFTPAMIRMTLRFPPDESHWTRWIVPHVLAAIAFGAADVLVERLAWLLLTPAAAHADLITTFLRRLFPNSLCYVAVVAITAVIRSSRISRDREQIATRLASQLTAARLQSLQAQLRPHFLFNTLSMIAEEVYVSPANADRMIGRLSYLLRASLASNQSQEVTLAEELDLVKAYLEIMEIRLAGRASFDIHVEPECLDAAMPALVLQPLVENAYRHGIEKMQRDGLMRISARRDGDVLEVEVADNGAGIAAGTVKDGVGLRIVRERIAELYGERAVLELKRRNGGGVRSILRIPYRQLPSWSDPSTAETFSYELAE